MLPLVLLSAVDLSDPWATIVRVALIAVWIGIAAGLAARIVRAQEPPSRAEWMPEAVVLLLVGALMITGEGAAWALLLLIPLHLLRVHWMLPRLHTATGRWHGALLALGGLVICGTAFAILESRSVSDGLWWALATMTTVGYGDVSPATTGGRAIGAVAMLVGIGLLASVVASVARHFEATAPPSETELAVLREIRALHERLDRLERQGSIAPSDGNEPTTTTGPSDDARSDE